MAKKRLLGDEPPAKVQVEDPVEVELPRKYQEVGWREWFLKDLLRYYFFLGCLFFDVLIPLGLLLDNGGLVTQFLTIIVLGVALVLEYLIYRKIWHSDQATEE
jgi:hypothetical protein